VQRPQFGRVALPATCAPSARKASVSVLSRRLIFVLGSPVIGSERRASPNLKAFGSRSRSASDASVATAGPCNHRPAVRPTPCRLAALCPWQRARIAKPGRVRWPEPPGLAAGSRMRGEAREECGAWSGLRQSVAPSHAPVYRTLRFLPLDCAAPSSWTIAPATSGLSEPVGTMVARWPRQSDLRPSAAGIADRRHRARGVRQRGRVALLATCALLHMQRRRRSPAI